MVTAIGRAVDRKPRLQQQYAGDQLELCDRLARYRDLDAPVVYGADEAVDGVAIDSGVRLLFRERRDVDQRAAAQVTHTAIELATLDHRELLVAILRVGWSDAALLQALRVAGVDLEMTQRHDDGRVAERVVRVLPRGGVHRGLESPVIPDRKSVV